MINIKCSFFIAQNLQQKTNKALKTEKAKIKHKKMICRYHVFLSHFGVLPTPQENESEKGLKNF